MKPVAIAPRVFVVILNWNLFEDTRACVESVFDLDYPNFEVVIVDNGSTDGSPERLRLEFPAARMIEAGRNRGFAGGNNLGIRHALAEDADFVWLLNNDTTVDPRALSALVDAASDPSVGIVGAVLYERDDPTRVQAWGGGSCVEWLGLTKIHTSPADGALDYVAGASMLIRREVFEDVGLLDETYFFYHEDSEFSIQARRHGWRLAVAADAAVYHASGASLDLGNGIRSLAADRLHARANGAFVGRHAGWRIVAAVPVRLAGMALRRTARGQIDRVPVLAREFLVGIRDRSAVGER